MTPNGVPTYTYHVYKHQAAAARAMALRAGWHVGSPEAQPDGSWRVAKWRGALQAQYRKRPMRATRADVDATIREYHGHPSALGWTADDGAFLTDAPAGVAVVAYDFGGGVWHFNSFGARPSSWFTP